MVNSRRYRPPQSGHITQGNQVARCRSLGPLNVINRKRALSQSKQLIAPKKIISDYKYHTESSGNLGSTKGMSVRATSSLATSGSCGGLLLSRSRQTPSGRVSIQSWGDDKKHDVSMLLQKELNELGVSSSRIAKTPKRLANSFSVGSIGRSTWKNSHSRRRQNQMNQTKMSGKSLKDMYGTLVDRNASYGRSDEFSDTLALHATPHIHHSKMKSNQMSKESFTRNSHPIPQNHPQQLTQAARLRRAEAEIARVKKKFIEQTEKANILPSRFIRILQRQQILSSRPSKENTHSDPNSNENSNKTLSPFTISPSALKSALKECGMPFNDVEAHALFTGLEHETHGVVSTQDISTLFRTDNGQTTNGSQSNSYVDHNSSSQMYDKHTSEDPNTSQTSKNHCRDQQYDETTYHKSLLDLYVHMTQSTSNNTQSNSIENLANRSNNSIGSKSFVINKDQSGQAPYTVLPLPTYVHVTDDCGHVEFSTDSNTNETYQQTHMSSVSNNTDSNLAKVNDTKTKETIDKSISTKTKKDCTSVQDHKNMNNKYDNASIKCTTESLEPEQLDTATSQHESTASRHASTTTHNSIQFDRNLQKAVTKVHQCVGRHTTAFVRLFNRFDTSQHGFLTQEQFVSLIGPGGLSINLSPNEFKALTYACSDQSTGYISADTVLNTIQPPDDISHLDQLAYSEKRAQKHLSNLDSKLQSMDKNGRNISRQKDDMSMPRTNLSIENTSHNDCCDSRQTVHSPTSTCDQIQKHVRKLSFSSHASQEVDNMTLETKSKWISWAGKEAQRIRQTSDIPSRYGSKSLTNQTVAYASKPYTPSPTRFIDDHMDINKNISKDQSTQSMLSNYSESKQDTNSRNTFSEYSNSVDPIWHHPSLTHQLEHKRKASNGVVFGTPSKYDEFGTVSSSTLQPYTSSMSSDHIPEYMHKQSSYSDHHIIENKEHTMDSTNVGKSTKQQSILRDKSMMTNTIADSNPSLPQIHSSVTRLRRDYHDSPHHKTPGRMKQLEHAARKESLFGSNRPTMSVPNAAASSIQAPRTTPIYPPHTDTFRVVLPIAQPQSVQQAKIQNGKVGHAHVRSKIPVAGGWKAQQLAEVYPQLGIMNVTSNEGVSNILPETSHDPIRDTFIQEQKLVTQFERSRRVSRAKRFQENQQRVFATYTHEETKQASREAANLRRKQASRLDYMNRILGN